MRQGNLITPASTKSNPYDTYPTKDGDAVEARSSTATGPGVMTQQSLGLNVTLRDIPLALPHTHRDARGMISTEKKCVHPECCARTEPENDTPPFPVPDGFSFIRNDQGEWLVVSRPSTGVSNARGAAIAPALPLFPTANRAGRSFEAVDISSVPGHAEHEMQSRIERSSARGPHSLGSQHLI